VQSAAAHACHPRHACTLLTPSFAQISRWPFQQRAWSEARALRENAMPIPETVVGEGAHEAYDIGALSIADAQSPPEKEVEKGVQSQTAPASLDVQGRRVQHKQRSQSSAALRMLPWHSMAYDDGLAAMADVFDTDELMQGCNSLTLETGGWRVAGCPNGRGLQRAPRQCPSPRTDSGGIWHDCGDELAQQKPEYMDMLSAYASAAEGSEVAQAVPEGPIATRHSSKQTGLTHAASRFLAATKAEAAMSQLELESLGYTDCDLSYLIGRAA
jgi:hypothetical protein